MYVVMVKGGRSDKKSGCYSVEVNYNLPIEEIIKGSRFKSIDSNLNSENFPAPGSGKDQTVVQLIRIKNRIVLGDQNFEMEAEAAVYEKGLQFVNIWELLAATKQHPNIRAVVPVFALGLSADIGSGLYVPGIYDQYPYAPKHAIGLAEV